MKLLTKTIEKSLPKRFSQENNPDPLCRVKLFAPWSNWSWYIIEYDPEERLCLGYVEGFENELGYFSLNELEQIKGPLGLKIERDLYFEPRKLSEIKGEKQ